MTRQNFRICGDSYYQVASTDPNSKGARRTPRGVTPPDSSVSGQIVANPELKTPVRNAAR
jgi:hypothetical protein